ncbi:MAG TPA: UDP-N-acetylmuramoyl-tripeptide--D-alanyl-D-alanine ligase [Thermoanaerobaculales bacterium]|nr:UDP-N-acetylmuramoyl-tripeptide--D-alanyl-D-alanine ligase [Thermoanaerobaculales bacterium]HQL30048.1 UDP-N-acetylmuramoyl-tripeptide--D-alanyl-D-alanine ligase [Thermoanaerobaculales bacterium]
MTALDVARAVGGDLAGDPSVMITGAEVDSRRVRGGDLFVALPGERCDGHQFVAEALAAGAAALVRGSAGLTAPEGRALIRVVDPLAAYWELARRERERRRWTIAAVTGSVGKTTVKDFLAHLLGRQRPTGASTGNRNSTLGLPAELLSQPDQIEVFVAEAGTSRFGELDRLGGILRPIGVLVYTRIAPVHTEFFGGLDGIVRAKGELLAHLDRAGTLVINAGDPRQQGYAAATGARVLRYGDGGEARIELLEDRGLLGTSFDLVVPGGRSRVELAVAGRHQAENLLAAAAAGAALGLTAEQIADAARDLRAAPHRGRVHRLAGGAVLVDDSYNASPVAVARMLELLASAEGRRIAVLGEMFELGELADEAHREIGAAAARSCDLLIAVGADAARLLGDAARAAGLGQVELVGDAGAAALLLGERLRAGDVVLVKGSRGVGLDRTVAALLGEEAA